MPTGYTADVQSGKITELKPFVMQLARGMGALVTMRDDAPDAPVPERFEPSPYYAERLASVETEVARIAAMSDDEAESAAETTYAEAMDAYDKAKAEHIAQRERYEAMIAKVKAWEGAPDGIKAFALSQLRDSINFDCREPFRFYLPIDKLTGVEWRARALREAQSSLEYARKAHNEEIVCTEARNGWLAQLRRSLA